MEDIEQGAIVETMPATDLKPGGEDPTSVEAAIDRAIHTWLTGHIYNSQVSASTEAYNHLARTLPALKSCLVAELASTK